MALSDIEDFYVLSPLQEGMLYHSLAAPASGLYVDQLIFDLAGTLDVAAFRRAWQTAVDRHPVLRTSFHWDSLDRPLQVVHPAMDVAVDEEDWRRLPSDVQRSRLAEFLTLDRGRGFDLGHAPLMRLELFRVGDARHRFVWSFHHIILDGWSTNLLEREVLTLYESFRSGTLPSLPPPVPYAAYLSWRRRQDPRAAETFWTNALRGFSSPTLIAGPAAGSTDGFGLSESLLTTDATSELRRFARRNHITESTLVNGAWALVLSRYCGVRDVVFGVTVAGRPSAVPRVETLLGNLINTVPLRIAVDPAQTVSSWLLGVQQRQLEVQPYEHASLADIQRWSAVRDGVPLVDSIVTFENLPRVEHDVSASSLEVRGVEHVFRTNYPLALQVTPGARLTLRAAFDRKSLSATAVSRLLGHLETVLQQFARRPDSTLAGVSLTTAAETHQACIEWNDTAVGIPASSIPALFEAHAAQSPRSTALISGERLVTYGELNAQANRCARYLTRRLQPHPECPVGIACHDPLLSRVGVLAALKAGCACVPLDVSAPVDRLAQVVKDGGVQALLCDERAAAALGLDVPLLRLDRDAGVIALEDASNVGLEIRPDRLAYIIYTSGSTGVPKGVEIPHGAIVRLTCGVGYVRLDESQTLLQMAPLSFDASFFELWGALLHGATGVLAPSRHLSVPELESLIARHRIITMWLTASLFNEIIDQHPAALVGVSQLIVGGEALSASHIARAQSALPGTQLVNGYGPTESTTFTNCYRIPRHASQEMAIPLGLPIANTRSMVLDRDLQLAPVGVAGELYVSGGGLARGYRGSPELTAERFVPCPFSTVPGARMYRTGDRARYRHDGTIDFLGRGDDQVKIRGYRIEPAEIETVLRRHPAVRQAVVLSRVEADTRRLCAFIVGRHGAELNVAGLEEHLRSQLPDYMIPSEWMQIDDIPLTATGKVDRARLMTAHAPARARPGGYVAPRTPVEDLLATLWASALGRSPVGVTDHFLALGGHSLLAVRLVSRIREAFAVDVPLTLIFEAPTVSEQAEQIERILSGDGGSPRPPLRPAHRGTTIPLSFAQERVWMLDQFDPGCPAYNVPVAIALSGRLDLRALVESLQATVRRHEVLRTTYHLVEGQPTQRVHAAGPIALPVVDLRQLAAAPKQRELERLCTHEARGRFDLAELPMLRSLLVQLADDNHVLLFTVHHIAADAWSMNVLVHEVTEQYAACCEHRTPALPPLTVQYADYAIWQREWLTSGALEEQLTYWRPHLARSPALDLATDRPRPPIQTFRGGSRTAMLSADIAAGIERLSHEERATPFMTLLAAFGVLLHRHTGQIDFSIGTPIANRSDLAVETLIGFFVNTLVIRFDLSGDPSFRDIVARVRREALNAYAHHEVPFEKLVAELQPARSLAVTPLFQVLFSFHASHTGGIETPHLRGTLVHVDNGSAKFDLTLAIIAHDQGLQLALEYNCDLFDATTAQRMVESYGQVMAEVVAAPTRRLATLGGLAAGARHQVVTEWNDTARGGRVAPEVVALLARQRAARPAAVALDFEGERWTYAALLERASAWAGELRRHGVGPEVAVGVSLARSVELVVAVVAVLEAGGAYVPLDPRLPVARRRQMVRRSGVRVVLGEPGDWTTVPEVTVVALTGSPASPAGAPGPAIVAPEQLAAVLYTSGSTGEPKGVMLTHGGLARLVEWVGDAYAAPVLQGVLGATALGFDLSVFELLGTLSQGGRVVLVDSALELAGMGAERGVRLVNTVPSAVRALVAGDGLPASVGVVNLAGEVVDRALVEQLYAQGVETVWNLYGPTEDTTYATGGVVPRGGAGAVSIGRSLPTKTAYVVDAAGELAPIGVAGELYLGGEGLGRGYVGDPAATAAQWVPHPWSGTPGARLYRTGDWVCRRADGGLHYLGRRDQQVKLRGYRIELSEIEAALRRTGLVQDAAVRLHAPAAGAPHLVAYYVPVDGVDVVAAGRQAIAEQLPDYMLPARWVSLEELPRLANGKVNRAALPEPDDWTPLPTRGSAAPNTDLERLIADIWRDALHAPMIGVHDNFFADLGGHSLLTIQVAAKLSAALDRSVTIIELFEFPTISALAVHLGNVGSMANAGSRDSSHPESDRGALRQAALQQRRQFKESRRTARGSERIQ